MNFYSVKDFLSNYSSDDVRQLHSVYECISFLPSILAFEYSLRHSFYTIYSYPKFVPFTISKCRELFSRFFHYTDLSFKELLEIFFYSSCSDCKRCRAQLRGILKFYHGVVYNNEIQEELKTYEASITKA